MEFPRRNFFRQALSPLSRFLHVSFSLLKGCLTLASQYCTSSFLILCIDSWIRIDGVISHYFLRYFLFVVLFEFTVILNTYPIRPANWSRDVRYGYNYLRLYTTVLSITINESFSEFRTPTSVSFSSSSEIVQWDFQPMALRIYIPYFSPKECESKFTINCIVMLDATKVMYYEK